MTTTFESILIVASMGLAVVQTTPYLNETIFAPTQEGQIDTTVVESVQKYGVYQTNAKALSHTCVVKEKGGKLVFIEMKKDGSVHSEQPYTVKDVYDKCDTK